MSAETAVDKARAEAAPAGHVIVCGLRGIGLRIVEQLHRAGESVTVLEEYADQTQLAVAVGWGVSTVAPFGSSGADAHGGRDFRGPGGAVRRRR